MGKVIYLLLFVFLLLPVVNADIDKYRQDTTIPFVHIIRLQGAADDNIVANITITDPNEKILVGFQPMTYNSVNKTFNYTLPASQTQTLGIYQRCITSAGGGLNDTTCFDFEITPTGSQFSTAQSIIYGLALILGLFLFSLSLYGAIIIPWRNTTSEDGFVIGMNQLKYVKLFLWFVSYMFLIWVAFFIWNITYGFLNFGVAANFFRGVFYFLLSGVLPIFVMFIIITIVRFLDDRKLSKALKRGLPFR